MHVYGVRLSTLNNNRTIQSGSGTTEDRRRKIPGTARKRKQTDYSGVIGECSDDNETTSRKSAILHGHRQVFQWEWAELRAGTDTCDALRLTTDTWRLGDGAAALDMFF